MKVEAIPFAKFFSNKNTIYKNIMIVSKRARQIIDSRYEKIAALNNIEDSDDIVEIQPELAIQTCNMYNYRYVIITEDDFVIPPRENDNIQKDTMA